MQCREFATRGEFVTLNPNLSFNQVVLQTVKVVRMYRVFGRWRL